MQAQPICLSLFIQADTANRHVASTGDIKNFVITEESGIAKGIRRVTAVTGLEAQRVNTLAEDFKSRLSKAESSHGSEKDSLLKALSVVSALPDGTTPF